MPARIERNINVVACAVSDGVEIDAALSAQRVISTTTNQFVVAVAGVDGVVPAAAGDHVRSGVADDRIIAVAGENIFDVGINVVPFAGARRWLFFRWKCRCSDRRFERNRRPSHFPAAGDIVGAIAVLAQYFRAPVEDVVAFVAIEGVVADSAFYAVVAVAAVDGVIAIAAEERVVIAAAGDGVISRTAQNADRNWYGA